jgi:hypothetical protein
MIVVIGLFFSISIFSQDSFGQSRTSTFESSRYDYTINQPSGFELRTANGIHIDYKVVNKDGSSISVNVSNRLPEEENIDAWSYSKEFFETVFSQSEPPIPSISKTEKTIIDGKKTFLIYYSYPSRGVYLKVIEAYLFVGDNAYVITTTSDEQHYDVHKNVFLETIKSIKFY